MAKQLKRMSRAKRIRFWRKKMGRPPFFDLSKHRVISEVVIAENGAYEDDHDQPYWRGEIEYKDGSKESIHLWRVRGEKGFVGETREPR